MPSAVNTFVVKMKSRTVNEDSEQWHSNGVCKACSAVRPRRTLCGKRGDLLESLNTFHSILAMPLTLNKYDQ